MSSVDPFELARSKKAWPSIPGPVGAYAKEHRDWIKRLVEESISLKNEVDSLKGRLVLSEAKIDEFMKERELKERTIGDLVKRIEALEQSTANQTSEIKRAVEETAKVTMAEVVKRGSEYKNDEFEVNLALANNKERREKEKRAKNIVIFGLRQEEDKKADDGQALELTDTLSVPREQVVRVTRLISKSSSLSSRPPPFLVEFNTSSTRDNALMATRNLKGLDKYNGVTIAHDLTPNERAGLKREQTICVELNKELPENSPFTWRVRNGERTKIDINTKRVYRPAKTNGSSA